MTTATDTRTDAHRQAVAQLESVAAMVAALEVDYDRLQELSAEGAELEKAFTDARSAGHDQTAAQALAELRDWLDENSEELRALEAAAGDCEDIDEAESALYENALSVELRSAWQLPGEELTPAEYRIVLCTGGPHVEMVGELGEDGRPDTVRVLFKDWSESGELSDFNCAAALEYARRIMGE